MPPLLGGAAPLHAAPAPLHAADDAWESGAKDLLPMWMLFDYWMKGNDLTEQ